MSKKKQVSDARQMDIFSWTRPQEPPAPGSMNISVRLRLAIKQALAGSGKDLGAVCAEIYTLSGLELTPSRIENWHYASRDSSCGLRDDNHNQRPGMPIEALPVFCQVTGSYELLFILAEACHYKALKGKDVVRARMGLLKEEISRKGQELKGLEKALLETEEDK